MLSSVVKHKDTVQRTVVTSSVAGKVVGGQPQVSQPDTLSKTALCFAAAVLGNESAVAPKNGSLYNEDDWNETSSIKNNEAYWLSKVSYTTCSMLVYTYKAACAILAALLCAGTRCIIMTRSCRLLHTTSCALLPHTAYVQIIIWPAFACTYNHVFGRHLQSERHGRQPRNMDWILSRYCQISFWVLHCHVKRPEA